MEGVYVQVVPELLGPDLVFVSQFTLFLGEKIVGFSASSLNVGFEGLLDLVFDVGEFGGKRSLAGVEFVIESLAEFGRPSSDFRVEITSVLKDTFFDKFEELLVNDVFTNLIS
jgi:hypothetical protein